MGAAPSVCPFVALAEDRDRRADKPDEGNRCYAERAPRRRDLAYQADYCYSPQFAGCSVFLAWAARNAAEPARVTQAAREAWASGVALPEEVAHAGGDDDVPAPTPEAGFFGLPDPVEAEQVRASEQLDWVSASAWAEVPWDEGAEEEEVDELDLLIDEAAGLEADLAPLEPPAEAVQAPKVPAALPMRRRKRPQAPIRTRGSGEWFYADPPGREPLVTRRRGVAPAILLAVLGILVVSIVAFLLATGLGGAGDQSAAAPSASPAAAALPLPTRAPVATAAPSAAPSPSPEPRPRTHTVKAGQTLSAIAARRGVSVKLIQCANRILNPNLIQPGQVLEIPPEGYTCPPGWRRATPEPEVE